MIKLYVLMAICYIQKILHLYYEREIKWPLGIPADQGIIRKIPINELRQEMHFRIKWVCMKCYQCLEGAHFNLAKLFLRQENPRYVKDLVFCSGKNS